MSTMRPLAGADPDSPVHVSGGLLEADLKLYEIAAPLLRVAKAPKGSDGQNRDAPGDEPGPSAIARDVFEEVMA